MTHPPLTAGDALDLAAVLDTTRVVKVAYAREGEYDILYGTARCLTGEDLGPRDFHGDVRDAYLRITTRAGWESCFPITELMAAHREGRFMAYDWE